MKLTDPAPICQVKQAAVLRLVAASCARTQNVCDPCGRSLYLVYEPQESYELPSSLHRNETPASVSSYRKVAFESFVGLVGVSLNVGGGGGAVSIVQVRESAALRGPPPCCALTWKVCWPLPSGPGYDFDPVVPLPQAPNEPPSSEQRNVTELVSV